MAGDDQGEGRSAQKRRAILAAARDIFLSKGYAGTSMDEVAEIAAVSKQTVYKQFGAKQSLFETIVTEDIEATARTTQDMVTALGSSEQLERDLRRFARQHVADLTQPDLLRLRRLIVAEADRFPDLARTWFAHGPERGHALLAEQLETLARRGLLTIDDALLAAEHLNWLIVSIPLNKAMLLGGQTTFRAKELNRYADEGIRIFLAGYGAR
ncbi:MAG TPA: TetR/AcrR family transcriptional regulator [Thermoleophilaceae bacterium]|nr:TetR/AcrR family transcriptional regulator [Thermoleophilaceae bacterium]